MIAPKSFLSLAKKSFPFWFGGIWLFCGAPFLIIGLYLDIDTFRLQERFKKEALVTEGMVLTKSITSRLCAGAITYAGVRTIIAFARA